MDPNIRKRPKPTVRGVLIVTAAVVIAVGVGAAVRNFWMGLLPLLSFGAELLVASRGRRRDVAAVRAMDPDAPVLNARLKEATLPAPWRVLATESKPHAAQMMKVDLAVREGWLTISQRQKTPGGQPSFAARVPVTSIESVEAAKSMLGFSLATGERLEFLLYLPQDVVERAAHVIRQAIQSDAQEGPHVEGSFQVTSSSPILRTPPMRAIGMFILFFPVFLVSVPGENTGWLCTGMAFAGFVFAGTLCPFRPRWMGPALAVAMGTIGLAFLADGIWHHQPLRLLAAAGCAALAVYIEVIGRRPFKNWALPPDSPKA